MSWPYTRKLKRVKDLNLNLYHLHSPFSLGLLGLFLAKKNKVPVIMTYHTLWKEYGPRYVPLPKKAMEAFAINMSKRFCNQLDLVIAPSKAMKEEVQSYHLKTDIEIIPTGFSIEQWNNNLDLDLRSKYQIPKDQKILMFVGRIGSEKNISLLIEAYSKIISKNPKSHLIIIGEGPDQKNCTSRVEELQMNSHVTFTGKLSREEVLTALKQADIFAFPSVTETQGLVVLEALASGIPTVAINKMGSIDYLEDSKGGILTEHSVDAFAQGMHELLNHPNLAQVKADALAKASLYTMEAVTDKLLYTYEKVYSENKARL